VRPVSWTAVLLACSCASAQPAPSTDSSWSAEPSGPTAATPTGPSAASPVTSRAAAPDRLRRANDFLDRALESTALDLRAEALVALAISRRPDARTKLADALEDEKGEVRFAAAQGFAHLADPTAPPLLAKAWKREKGWAVKKEIAYAAGACGARELIPDLRTALKDGHRELQVAAALALKSLGDPGAETRLARLGNPPPRGLLKEGADRWSRKVLEGKREGARSLAARTLAEHGTREDLPLLEPLLGSEVATERLWSAAAIVRFDR
jgi:HEAT repeat protein